MGNGVYTCEKENYDVSRERISGEDAGKWFFNQMRIGVEEEKEDKVREHMERCRDSWKQKAVSGEEIYPAAKPFYDLMISDSDELLGIFRRMPKGGLLHVHSAAALSTDGYLELLLTYCGKAETGGGPKINVLTRGDNEGAKYIEGMLLFDYQCRNLPEEVKFRSLSEVIRNIRGRAWLKKMLSISDEYLGSKTDIWTAFNRIFARIDNLYTNRDFYIDYHVAFFQECVMDKINYVELRSGFQEFQDREEKNGKAWVYGERHSRYHVNRHLYYKELTQIVNVKDPDDSFLEALLMAKDMADPDGKHQLKFKVILNARRNLDPNKPEELDKLSKKVDAAIKIKESGNEKLKSLVIGFDFVSEEDRGQDTAFYADQVIYKPFGYGYGGEGEDLRPRIQRINFFLHDGESCWKADDNMLSAALISKHRIGHGFNLNWFSRLADEILHGEKDAKSGLREPVLEICPISNQLLRYYQDIRNHSAYELMKNGICCVIANDDPLLLGNGGLSYDFWEAYVGMELPYEAIKTSVFIAYLYQEYVYGEEYGCGELSPHPVYDRTKERFEREWGDFVDTVYQQLEKGGR